MIKSQYLRYDQAGQPHSPFNPPASSRLLRLRVKVMRVLGTSSHKILTRRRRRREDAEGVKGRMRLNLPDTTELIIKSILI
jgi:hypothetical protein